MQRGRRAHHVDVADRCAREPAAVSDVVFDDLGAARAERRGGLTRQLEQHRIDVHTDVLRTGETPKQSFADGRRPTTQIDRGRTRGTSEFRVPLHGREQHGEPLLTLTDVHLLLAIPRLDHGHDATLIGIVPISKMNRNNSD